MMRRIYYSSNFFRPTNISCFRYLRILSFSYYSVIKVQIHCLTSERCHRSFQEHRSLFNTILFLRGTAQAVDKKRPGTHRNFYKLSVEMAGFEPATFALQRRCSPTELHPQDLLPRVSRGSGLDRIRTCDPCVISTVL